MNLILIAFIVFILFVIVVLRRTNDSMADYYETAKATETAEGEHIAHTVGEAKTLSSFVIPLLVAVVLLVVYFLVKDSIYLGHMKEWMNLAIRWFHITIGIAWIGASFYFVFLENSLNRTKNLRDELAGNLWAVHGGGFYYVEKYKIAPKVIPKDLHWFKYEAYFTWLSGIVLLFVVYYFNAESMLVDPNVMDISPYFATFLGVASLAAGWLIYDYMSKTPLIKNNLWFAIIGFTILTIFAWYYAHIFSGRAAYIHFGALIGTLMAGNVFFVIIPAQKALVKAAKEGSYLDPWLGKHAGLRSLHNNYFTLPILFVMISNHFPSTFGHEQPWAILAGISLGSAGIKHYLNLQEKGEKSVWVMPISVMILLGVVFATAPAKPGECNDNVSFTEVYSIINERCVTCHSSKPTHPTWTAPPNGVKYDTPEEIQKMSEKIMQRVVITQTMPQNNETGMQPEERDLIRCWIEQGSNIDF